MFHLRVLKEVKSTEENIKAAIEGETHEYREMYPKFIEKAKEAAKAVAEEDDRKYVESEISTV